MPDLDLLAEITDSCPGCRRQTAAQIARQIEATAARWEGQHRQAAAIDGLRHAAVIAAGVALESANE